MFIIAVYKNSELKVFTDRVSEFTKHYQLVRGQAILCLLKTQHAMLTNPTDNYCSYRYSTDIRANLKLELFRRNVLSCIYSTQWRCQGCSS